jgi:hypothetical protein
VQGQQAAGIAAARQTTPPEQPERVTSLRTCIFFCSQLADVRSAFSSHSTSMVFYMCFLCSVLRRFYVLITVLLCFTVAVDYYTKEAPTLQRIGDAAAHDKNGVPPLAAVHDVVPTGLSSPELESRI